VKARFLSTAELELKEAIEFYEAAREGLGTEFLAEIGAAVSLIEAHPLAWMSLSPQTRRCRTSRFPFGPFLSSQIQRNLDCFCDGSPA